MKNVGASNAPSNARGLKPVEEMSRGCRCIKSHCLKKYCECFQQSRVCDDRCQCLDCHNRTTPSLKEEPPVILDGEGYRSLSDYKDFFFKQLCHTVPLENAENVRRLDELLTDNVVEKVCS